MAQDKEAVGTNFNIFQYVGIRTSQAYTRAKNNI